MNNGRSDTGRGNRRASEKGGRRPTPGNDSTGRPRKAPSPVNIARIVLITAPLVLALAAFMVLERLVGPPRHIVEGIAVEAQGQPMEEAVFPVTTPADGSIPIAEGGHLIQDLSIEPRKPTRADVVQARIVAADRAAGNLTYHCAWKVNEETVQEGAGCRLDLAPYRVRDVVALTVTPYAVGIPGFAVEGPIIAIHPSLPTLSLEAARTRVLPGEPVRLQLTSNHPDGYEVTFSLEPPLAPGMVIDASSGEILFTPEADQKGGTIQFGAAVEDSEGTRVSKVFEFTLYLQ